jgi:hypothetical protein
VRTIHVELDTPVGPSMPAFFGGDSRPRMRISTEVIVGDDGDAREAGRDACAAITEFIAGYGEVGSGQ